MNINQLLVWLEEQALKAPTYPERVAYNATIAYIKDNQC